MKKVSPLIFLALMLCIVSCKKDNEKPDAKNVTITGIEVITMPLTDNGGSWDLDGDGDLTFEIINQSTVLYDHPEYYQDVQAQDLPLNFIINNGYKLPTLDQPYSILLYDYDTTSGDDYIGGISFTPSNYKSERPEYKVFSDGNVQVKVKFAWE